MPLVGENRVIAKLGLGVAQQGPHTVGLRALLEASGLTGKTIDSYQVGFMLAPRVNAAGRMSTPDIATRLLLATDEAMASTKRAALAQQLNDENLRRQQEEAELVAQAKKAIETDPAIGAHNVLVVGGEGWHRGVIGIVASKLVDAYPQARDRPVGRRRRRARLVPQHSRPSTCSPRSSAAPISSCASAATSRPPA